MVKNRMGFKGIIRRYYKLFCALVVPLIAAIVYFKANHVLGLAYEQFYSFNREVYPQYTSGLGERVIQPFVNAVQNFFSIIETNFNSIVTASATNVNILQPVLMGLAVGIIIKLLEKKQYVIGLSLGSMMVFSATRGYEFHGVAAWYLAVLIIALYIDLLINTFHKMGKPIIGFIAIILANTYFVSAGNNLLYEQSSISELESRVVEITANDENKDIFFDATCCDSLYLSYKNRKPVNPVVYMLPWYMDWYEDENVNALLETLPHVAVYNEDRAIWEMSHYTFVFDNELKTHYTRLSDVAGGNSNDWTYSVWIKKE